MVWYEKINGDEIHSDIIWRRYSMSFLYFNKPIPVLLHTMMISDGLFKEYIKYCTLSLCAISQLMGDTCLALIAFKNWTLKKGFQDTMNGHL